MMRFGEVIIVLGIWLIIVVLTILVKRKWSKSNVQILLSGVIGSLIFSIVTFIFIGDDGLSFQTILITIISFYGFMLATWVINKIIPILKAMHGIVQKMRKKMRKK